MSGLALVTGAAGFIGAQVVRQLLEQGRTVFGIGHPGMHLPSAPGRFHWLAGDVERAQLRALGCSPELIVHCAGGSSVARSVEAPQEDEARTVGAAREVLAFAREAAPDAALVLVSSAAVYGHAERQPITEDSALAPISPYGRHKRAAEEAWQASARDGARAAVVRLFSVYGEGLRKQLLWDACGKLTAGDTMFGGTGQEQRDWLHVRDAADLLALAGAHAAPDCPIVNGASGQAVSTREVLDVVAQTLQCERPPRFSGVARAGDPQRYWADIGLARGWGWAPAVDWREGVRDYARWYSQEGGR